MDQFYLNSDKYKAAQAADNCFVSPYAKANPQREDLAETMPVWFMTRYRKEQLEPGMYDKIVNSIPNRLAFIDSLNLDVSPNY